MIEVDPTESTDTITEIILPAKVILFNDSVHSFEEVIGQLIKAIRCDVKKAEALAHTVDKEGKAVVFEGQLPECLRVSHVLEEIALMTQIEW
jgi:ATP-dependent Clp protease adaptor protein ClpS